MKRPSLIKIVKYILLIATLSLFFVILYNYIKFKTFKFEFSQKYLCENISTKEQAWLFVEVNNPELEVALIEKLRIVLVSDSFKRVYEINLDKDLLLEDNTKYNKRNVIRVSDILIRSSTINESNNYLESIKWYVEEIMSYRIDQVIIIPPIVYSRDKLEINTLNDAVFDLNWKNVLVNGSEIKKVTGQIYSTASPSQVVSLRNKLNEYNVIEKKISPMGDGEDIEAGRVYEYVETEQWNDLLRSLEIYENLLLEQAQIEIYNASNITGEGMRLSRWFKNLGLVVVRAENAPLMVLESCSGNMIYVVDQEKYKESLTEVVEIIDKRFGNNIKMIYNRPEFVATGDIVIVLCEKQL